MRVVFDVDGCLIDSRELIIQAYHDAGVIAPSNILEREGINWLGARGYTVQEIDAIKVKKNVHYLHHLLYDNVLTLPPYTVAQRLAGEGHMCYAYTGAPLGTINVLKTRLSSWPFSLAVDGITTSARMVQIRLMHGIGVYVDDQSRLVNLPNNWHFVHYTRQDVNELYQDIVNYEGLERRKV